MKYKKLIVFCVSMVGICTVGADPNRERVKQYAQVGLHLAKVIAGMQLWQIGWDDRIKESKDKKWIMGGSLLLVCDGLYELKNDLHRHIFTHLNAWWNYKSQKKDTEIETAEV